MNPDRVTGRRSNLRPVKPALSDAEYLRVSSLARTDWWPLIRQAIRVWETADHHGSVVQPEWMPVQLLVDMFAEHGADVDVVAATIFKLEQMTGDIVQRTIQVDGVQHHVVKLTGHSRDQIWDESTVAVFPGPPPFRITPPVAGDSTG